MIAPRRRRLRAVRCKPKRLATGCVPRIGSRLDVRASELEVLETAPQPHGFDETSDRMRHAAHVRKRGLSGVIVGSLRRRHEPRFSNRDRGWNVLNVLAETR